VIPADCLGHNQRTEQVAALPLFLRKAFGFPQSFYPFEALPPRGVAADYLRDARKGEAFPQGQRQSRTHDSVCYTDFDNENCQGSSKKSANSADV
jgi:hypothetical protein